MSLSRSFPLLTLIPFLLAACSRQAEGPREVSGVYPHLTVHNREGECGIGAVVPWADRLWVITYGPHLPDGSSDRLWEIDPALRIAARPESVGGTPANRMIHRETGQLLIGPYVIAADGGVRVIPPSRMRGRLTGNARHLDAPGEKAYYATMEEGLYEVDLRSLEVRELIADGNPPRRGATPEPEGRIRSQLPGYHGKGLYSGQGRVIYANNGEHHARVAIDPTLPSGALAEWRGSGDWSMVRRAQFTEVTGPGGIEGSAHPAEDPVWSVGWDAKSLLLMVLHRGEWTTYRLPKPSHSYDGSHGWNTEWPRIREVGEKDLLMTMHGAFWRFPRGFRPGATGGLAPRSAYLRVVGDFARWGDRIVLGCDDHAQKEFLNTRPMKAREGAALVSHSNLWFVEPGRLDRLGPVVARGSVWLREDVPAGGVSDPFLIGGFELRSLALAQTGTQAVRLEVEIDAEGDGDWRTWRAAEVPAGGAAFLELPRDLRATWVRLRSAGGATGLTAHVHCREADRRPARNGEVFKGLARSPVAGAGGTLRSLSPEQLGWLDEGGVLRLLGRDLALAPGGTEAEARKVAEARAPEVASVRRDTASLVVEEDGRRWRLPVGEPGLAEPRPGARLAREVATERDLMNLGGTFFELPARNAQGMAKVRPVATHGLAIGDFCGQFGLIALTGVEPGATGDRIVRSADGAALWLGVIDDLWQLGRPRGTGGPWKATAVQAGEVSDPYLLSGYQSRTVTLSTEDRAEVTLEVDLDGTGVWATWARVACEPGKARTLPIPDALGAYWIRARADRATVATVQLEYR
jgi:hypothetical protein